MNELMNEKIKERKKTTTTNYFHAQEMSNKAMSRDSRLESLHHRHRLTSRNLT